jgi:hypothetical protein
MSKALAIILLSFVLGADLDAQQYATLPISISEVTGLSGDLATLQNQITQVNNTLANLLSIVQIHGEIPAGSIDGSNVVFTLKNLPSPSSSVTLYRNGLRQSLGGDYTLSGATITFLSGSTPQPGDSLVADYQDPIIPYSHALTINHTLVPNVDEANFPVYVVLSDPTLATTANGGHVQNASGSDIAFFADPRLTQVLAFEIVSYNPQSGVLTAVVNCPNVSHTVDTTFYVGYGSPNVTFSSNPTAVWSTYSGVYHLEDNAANTNVLNSASGEGQATNGASVNNTSGMSATGLLGAGLSFNGSTDGLDLGAFSVINGATTLTYSGWVNFKSLSQYATLISKFDPSTKAGSGITLSGNYTTSDQDWLTGVRTTSATADTTSGFAIQTGVWYHFAYVYRNGTPSLYINGSAVTLRHYGPADAVPVPSVTSDLRAGYGISGVLDELRISTQALSANWIATEYNNESNPTAFVSMTGETLSQPAGRADLYH